MAKHDEQVPWGWASPRYNEHLWTVHRLGTSEVDAMFTKQEGLCPGCLKEIAHPYAKVFGKFGLQPDVDHKHNFNADGSKAERKPEDFRGLLCQKCNVWIGRMKDNLEVIMRLAVYLKAYEDKINGTIL